MACQHWLLSPNSQCFFFFIFCYSMLTFATCNLEHSRFIIQWWTFKSSIIHWVWGSLMNTKQGFKRSSSWFLDMHIASLQWFKFFLLHWSTIYVKWQLAKSRNVDLLNYLPLAWTNFFSLCFIFVCIMHSTLNY